MTEEIIELTEDVSASPLYSADLAPVPKEKRTWTVWSLAALWVGMAVCIPTYLLASYMMQDGMGWLEALIIIGVANLVITIPMILNGHAGVKYGIPFPVVGRSSFGIKGVHLPSITRGIVACGWFGIQTWIGGLALYEICYAFSDSPTPTELNWLMFLCFSLFWLLNMFFIWKGTDSIKWLEEWSAPILILMGIVLIGWGAYNAGGIGVVLDQSEQLRQPSFTLENGEKDYLLKINPIKGLDNQPKAQYYQYRSISNSDTTGTDWLLIPNNGVASVSEELIGEAEFSARLKFENKGNKHFSKWVTVEPASGIPSQPNKLWQYIKWLTVMLGFWATMSLSIADITRFSSSQKAQKAGQFIGLPGTMILYSFVAIFVTCASLVLFDDVLIADDAPWDPTALLGKFQNPWVVIIAQVFMIIATLSTNIAANVIAPSNAFSNLFPKKISFKAGGTITGIIGIIICPWWLMSSIADILIVVSGFLGPVLGIMLCDYFFIRKKRLQLAELYKINGLYSYSKGINWIAMISLILGIFGALIWYVVPDLWFLSDLAWFTGFIITFVVYYVVMKGSTHYKQIKQD